MPIVCQPAAQVGALSPVVGGYVRAVDNLNAAARLLTEDPAETLVVIGP